MVSNALSNTSNALTIERSDELPQLEDLRRLVAEHPFWQNDLFQAMSERCLSREDYRHVFGQYYGYSKNFTRFLASFMSICESEEHRAELSKNMWDEGGGGEPERRHVSLFKTFLHQGLGLADSDAVTFEDCTLSYVHQYSLFCARETPMAVAAFLSLGTEAIVGRMYGVFLDALRRVGVAEEYLSFFHVHIESDDDHALTLEQIMRSYADEPGWYETCRRAVLTALDLRTRYFNSLLASVQRARMRGIVQTVNSGPTTARPIKACVPTEVPLYENDVPNIGVRFSVTRLACDAQVLDPRLLRVPPGGKTERHRHAHETFLYALSGEGIVTIEGTNLPIAAGEGAFVPRWALHQTCNEGPAELRILAVTDYGLTSCMFLGVQREYRLKKVETVQ